MYKLFYAKNILKALGVIARNQTMSPVSSFYDPKYPPWKYLLPRTEWIHIKCLMCGFPRTGTHWIRNVIEMSSGYKTGNLFEGKPSYNDKEVALVKIHARSRRIALAKAIWLLPPFRFDNKFIYVYRDPRDAIISLYEMTKTHKHNSNLNPDKFIKLYDPIRQYKWEINEWVINKPDNVYLVKFEDLKQNPKIEYEGIFDYLELKSAVNEKSIYKLVATYDHKKRPRGKAFGWRTAPSDYRPIIDLVNNKLEKEIHHLGYLT